LAALVAKHPDLQKHLYTDKGALRSFVNVYVNDEDVRYLEKEATPLKDGDTIAIVPSIAGGVDVVLMPMMPMIARYKSPLPMCCCRLSCR